MPTPGCLQTGRLSQKQILSSVTCRTSGPPQRCRAACRTEHQRHSSAIDGRANQHGSYAVSPRIRRRIEQAFGWIKTVAEQAKTSFRDLDHVARALAQTAGVMLDANSITIPTDGLVASPGVCTHVQ